MSLSTDTFFCRALRDDAATRSAIGDRIYNPGLTDEELDNAPLPYAVVALGGCVNEPDTKDEGCEGVRDRDTVTVTIAAQTRAGLGRTATLARHAVAAAWRLLAEDGGWDALGFEIEDYAMSAGPVELDYMRPCVFQTLTYTCVTRNDV